MKNLNKKLFKYIKNNSPKFILLLVTLYSLDLLNKIPYINLFFRENSFIIPFMVFCAVMILFKFTLKKIVTFIFLLIVVNIIVIISLGSGNLSELLGNIIFVLAVYSFIEYLFGINKDIS